MPVTWNVREGEKKGRSEGRNEGEKEEGRGGREEVGRKAELRLQVNQVNVVLYNIRLFIKTFLL